MFEPDRIVVMFELWSDQTMIKPTNPRYIHTVDGRTPVPRNHKGMQGSTACRSKTYAQKPGKFHVQSHSAAVAANFCRPSDLHSLSVSVTSRSKAPEADAFSIFWRVRIGHWISLTENCINLLPEVSGFRVQSSWTTSKKVGRSETMCWSKFFIAPKIAKKLAEVFLNHFPDGQEQVRLPGFAPKSRYSRRLGDFLHFLSTWPGAGSFQPCSHAIASAFRSVINKTSIAFS